MEGWILIDGKYLNKRYEFPDFKLALKFVNEIARVIELKEHHPELFISYGEVEVKMWTDKISALSARDFEVAGRFDEIYKDLNRTRK